MQNGSVEVSVIVPTLAERTRQAQIHRCIASIRRSSKRPVRVIVVVNGHRRDIGVVSWLEEQEDLLVAHEPMPSPSIAVLRGRALVATPYFCVLDDDDEYLDGATDDRLAALHACPDADLVVTNGFRNRSGIDTPAYSRLDHVAPDPLGQLFEANWLASCGALYRSSSVGLLHFADPFPLMEWTWLAFKLTVDRKRILVLDRPGFRIHLTPGSLSQSDAYKNALIPLYRRMLEADGRWGSKELPTAIRRTIRKKLSAAYHDRASRLLEDRERVPALDAHLRSLLLPGGLRYLPFSRRIVPGWPRAVEHVAAASNDETQGGSDIFSASIDEERELDSLYRHLSADCAHCRDDSAGPCFRKTEESSAVLRAAARLAG